MINHLNEPGYGASHSKLILIGEHAVVYQRPAIAVPFDAVFAEVSIKKTTGTVELLSDFYRGSIDQLPDKMIGLKEVVVAVCKKIKKPVRDFNIQLNSTIPIGRGLGSSAAIACSIIRGLYSYFNQSLDLNILRELVDVSETYAHGNPSGIDREAIISDEPIWYIKNEEPESIDLKETLHLVVADTGRIGDTHLAVDSVKQLKKAEPQKTTRLLNTLEHLTVKARESLKTGALKQLGQFLTEAHEQLKQLGVSDPGLNHYVDISIENGALGAKLTGGGRGGCMLALADSVESALLIERALKGAGAAKTWCLQLTSGVMNSEKNSTRTH